MQANRRSKSAVAFETRDVKRPNDQRDPGKREEGVEGEDEFGSVGSAHSRPMRTPSDHFSSQGWSALQSFVCSLLFSCCRVLYDSL